MLDAVPDDCGPHARGVRRRRAGGGVPEAAGRAADPTLNVRGLSSAFVGDGARTIIPDRATAALDMRLVKETTAADLIAKLRAHIQAQGYRLVDADPDDATRAANGKIARLARHGEPTSAFRTPVADPYGARGGGVADADVRPAAGAAADARRHRPDRAVHRRARLSRRWSCRS